MQRFYNSITFIIILLFGLSLFGCVSSGRQVQYKWNVIHHKKYDISGQVLDYAGAAIKNCQVYLIQRKFKVKDKKNIEANTKIIKVNHVDNTDSIGQFYFAFEPDVKANDIWVSFLDPKNTYEYKAVCINNKLGDTILQYPGNNPVLINVVLDKPSME